MLIPILITIVIILTVLVAIMLVIVLQANSAQRRELAGQKSSIDAVCQQIQDAKQSQDKFGLTVDKSLQTNRDSLDKHLLSNKETINKLYTQLGELSKSSEQMLNVGDDVRKLQDIFKNPKFRGQTGERSLEKCLAKYSPRKASKFNTHSRTVRSSMH